ncbi:Fe-S cluster assembly protein SufB [Phycisphaera mikurensis]|uniref:FeS cluster assembly protein SufB n=1 Tax=Phycisphaera mikurensis (strain NBRC 102666 / KCTC 22515 / FYK2301M01) TaxID=1142394 RepID=I0IB43_PHYMF|nr:Fe-S cluster assembly protein SufB [Phycisphaera mikurensis]MBB6442982.1 Fe-S cluster assembly protein SufB [Phycisphaera mikurensis]BAM02481.1 FeS cluster assembly protein SufB [Phycisphaera mikurensis NBRC 102666]
MTTTAEVAELTAERAEYKHGWTTDIEQEFAEPGLNEDVVRFISAKKNEPQWMLDWRLRAFRHFQKMTEPDWQFLPHGLPPIDLDSISYWAAPKKAPGSLDEVDPKLLETYEKLGISLAETKALLGIDETSPAEAAAAAAALERDGKDGSARKVAVDAVFDSVSVKTTFQDELREAGVIFCSMSEAARDHPELLKKHLGSVIPPTDNYWACLNSAVFSDGSFVYVPKGTKCPMELSTYFRINAKNTGQFERTLIVCEEGAEVSYLEGCTAPQRDDNQLHAAVVELVAEADAKIKYSTIQNWYPGDENGRGGIYNFVTKRGVCNGNRAHISWTQVETGSAITWKYPSVVMKGDDSKGEFYSVALTTLAQQADTGTKMIHIGKNTTSTIISKGISAGRGQNTYRGLVEMRKTAKDAHNFTQCDSILIGQDCGAHTFPYVDVRNPTATSEHEASTTKIAEDQLFYCTARGISEEDAMSLLVNGFCKEVFSELPMEFAVEANKLLAVSLEGSVG